MIVYGDYLVDSHGEVDKSADVGEVQGCEEDCESPSFDFHTLIVILEEFLDQDNIGDE